KETQSIKRIKNIQPNLPSFVSATPVRKSLLIHVSSSHNPHFTGRLRALTTIPPPESPPPPNLKPPLYIRAVLPRIQEPVKPRHHDLLLPAHRQRQNRVRKPFLDQMTIEPPRGPSHPPEILLSLPNPDKKPGRNPTDLEPVDSWHFAVGPSQLGLRGPRPQEILCHLSVDHYIQQPLKVIRLPGYKARSPRIVTFGGPLSKETPCLSRFGRNSRGASWS
ncbi:UPF0182 protein Lxx09300, partial [Striga asiatica]